MHEQAFKHSKFQSFKNMQHKVKLKTYLPAQIIRIYKCIIINSKELKIKLIQKTGNIYMIPSLNIKPLCLYPMIVKIISILYLINK